MGGVAVVTDSAADLSLELAEGRDLRVVPMSVAFGSDVRISGVTISDEEFYARLGTAQALPTTSQPAPPWFEEAYADAADAGADAIVSIHVSGALSGTVGLARRVADSAALPVEVVDSRQVSGGQALMVLAAQRAAAAGGGVPDVLRAAHRVRDDLESLVVVDTLDYLKKGGRVSGLQALVGSVLRVKPVLGVRDGRVEVVERTRTWSRARDRLVEHAVDHLRGRPAHAVVTHALAPDRAADLLDHLDERAEISDSLTMRIGPIIGTHTGPGAVALAVSGATDGPA